MKPQWNSTDNNWMNWVVKLHWTQTKYYKYVYRYRNIWGRIRRFCSAYLCSNNLCLMAILVFCLWCNWTVHGNRKLFWLWENELIISPPLLFLFFFSFSSFLIEKSANVMSAKERWRRMPSFRWHSSNACSWVCLAAFPSSDGRKRNA